ncbi:MAG: thiamine diphosphokinase [Fusobacteriales bacterium]|jgi:thiamine pyrophosphokinase|nr:thiamine diphosphokinase [Fusobacteriales bacterium]
MKAVIFLNGEYDYKDNFLKKIIDKDTDIFCADGGTNYCLERGYVPKCIYGDLDSIKSEILDKITEMGIKTEKFSPDKDFSDFELVLEEMGYENYKEIYVVGALGKRIDFTLNNIFLMEKYKKLIILTEKEKIFFREESFTIVGKAGKILSMVSLDSEIEGITLKGFRYPLLNRYIKRDSSILMSNVILADEAEVIFKKGKIVVILYV